MEFKTIYYLSKKKFAIQNFSSKQAYMAGCPHFVSHMSYFFSPSQNKENQITVS